MVALLLVLVLIAAFDLAALEWGVDSRGLSTTKRGDEA